MTRLWAAPVFLLVGCSTSVEDSSSSTTSSVTIPTGTAAGTPVCTPPPNVLTWGFEDDGQTPQDTDGDGVVDAGCGDELVVSTGTLSRRETGGMGLRMGLVVPGGGTAEDCMSAGSLCHAVEGREVRLQQVCTDAELVAGQTTLFGAADQGDLTVMLENDCGCNVWGDASYYASLGCIEL